MSNPKNDFSQGSVKRWIISQAVPLTLAQAVQLLYNIVDRIYIGHLEGAGDLALTGMGITFPVIVIIAAFTGLFSTGGTTLFSIARGEQKHEEAEKILGNVFTLLASASAVLFLLFQFCCQIQQTGNFFTGEVQQLEKIATFQSTKFHVNSPFLFCRQ